MTRRMAVEEHRSAVGGHRVRSLHHLPHPGGAGGEPGLVVVLPGLGLPGYSLPTAKAIAALGVECAVLDLPGFGSAQPRTARPDIEDIGSLAGEWALQVGGARALVLVGHSTGAQAALVAALTVQAGRRRMALVMAGPTFRPPHRRLSRLLAATPSAYRDDSPAEIRVAEVLRARLDLVRLIASGLRDRPECRMRSLAAPVTFTAGEHDSYAPLEWLHELATSASKAACTRTSVVAGSHNNLYTHPEEVAGVVALALADARAWR